MSGAHGGEGDTEEEEGRLGILEIDEATDHGSEGTQETIADEGGADRRGTEDTDGVGGTRGTPTIGLGTEQEGSNHDHSHLAGLRWRPRAGPLDLKRAQTW